MIPLQLLFSMLCIESSTINWTAVSSAVLVQLADRIEQRARLMAA